ncbi:MAG: potassium transporter TrkG, partial [Desulfotignum sp.]
MMTCASMTRIGMQGFLLAMSPLPLLFLFAETGHIGGPAFWRLILAVAAAVSIFSCALTLFCKPIAGKFLGVAGAAGGYISAWPHIMTSPYFALTATILLIGIIFLLADFTFEGPAARKTLVETQKPVWEIFLSHPARVLVVTFLGLCAMGTLLLLLPVASETRNIGFVDAVFTAVSAVCVTGLIVLDTPNDFTGYGQFFILVLIQLGGLGIMGITTVALHAMGRRLSLNHERVLASMADTSHKDLVQSLVTILKFTLAAEGLGAVLLTVMFYTGGDTGTQAVWRGVFTAVSAFCNAGFALQSDSLMSWHEKPLILHIAALLIIFGGMAPATSLVIPRWLAGRQVPIPARIALAASVVLLVLGTVFILAFEWGGLLTGLSVSDKIQNAWFQSVTLRTAGFNSLDIAGIANPTFLLMIAFMFIGGSPGGTAGG